MDSEAVNLVVVLSLSAVVPEVLKLEVAQVASLMAALEWASWVASWEAVKTLKPLNHLYLEYVIYLDIRALRGLPNFRSKN